MSQKILKNQKSRVSFLRKLANILGVPSIKTDVALHTIAIRSIDKNCLEVLRAQDALFKNFKAFKEQYLDNYRGIVSVQKRLRKDLNTLTSIVVCLGILTLLNIFLTVLSLCN